MQAECVALTKIHTHTCKHTSTPCLPASHSSSLRHSKQHENNYVPLQAAVGTTCSSEPDKTHLHVFVLIKKKAYAFYFPHRGSLARPVDIAVVISIYNRCPTLSITSSIFPFSLTWTSMALISFIGQSFIHLLLQIYFTPSSWFCHQMYIHLLFPPLC